MRNAIHPNALIGLFAYGHFPSIHPGGVDEHARNSDYLFPLSEIWDKGIGIETGRAPVKRYKVHLRDMIINGHAKPSLIVTQRLPLIRVPEAYEHFVHRGVGEGKDYTKVVLKPALDRAA